jgi:mannose-6-phosphate isomerase-like protein (cupin superfamily)
MSAHLAVPSAADDLVAEFLGVLATRFARVVREHERTTPLSRPGERAWKKLASTSTYDVWMIVWPPGTAIAEHDHGHSTAAFCVVAGALVNRPADARARVIPAGGVATVPARHRHAVQNAHVTDAVSVHVYSPPLGDDWRP